MEPMQAVSHFEVTVTKEPNLPVAHYLLGFAYLAGAQNHLVLGSFIETLRLDPYFSEADLALADIYYKQEEFDFSLEHVRRVCVVCVDPYRDLSWLDKPFRFKSLYEFRGSDLLLNFINICKSFFNVRIKLFLMVPIVC